MAIRYSQRQLDGSIEYYDSREEMEAANPTSTWGEILLMIAGDFNPLLAFWGFIVGVIASVMFFSQFELWETWVRFSGVIITSIIVSYISGRIGNIIFIFGIISIIATVIFFAGKLVWNNL